MALLLGMLALESAGATASTFSLLVTAGLLVGALPTLLSCLIQGIERRTPSDEDGEDKERTTGKRHGGCSGYLVQGKR